MTGKELEQIYNEAYKAVYWTAMALMKNEADAEDIVQDTFVALIESYDSIKDKSKVTAWLKKTAANKCLNRIKLSRTDNMDDEFFEGVEAVPEDFLPDSIVESEDARKIVMNIINNSLSDDIRRTLILFYFDEMSIKEIAVLLGVPEGTVSRRLNFARNKIKKEVEKYEKDNDTKLFSMALPFLSKLFMKEAELVPFKAMPAKLISLSASAEASKAGTNIAKMAVKKGTDIMKTKILIGSIAAVVAVGATVGTILGVVSKKSEEKPSVSNTTSISEENGIIENNAEGITEATSEEGAENSVEAGSEFGAAGRNYVNFNDLKVKINGKVITMNQSTVQDLVDIGCYVNPHLLDRSFAYGNKVSDSVEAGQLVYMTVFDMDDEENRPSGQNAHRPLVFIAKAETAGTISECVICGVHFRTEDIIAWEDEIEFEFPLDLTSEELVKDSGEASSVETGTTESWYWYEFEDSSMVFHFKDGSLISIMAEYDEGSIIDLQKGLISAT